MLQRIYGTAWRTKQELSAYYDFKAEAARRCCMAAECTLLSLLGALFRQLVTWPVLMQR